MDLDSFKQATAERRDTCIGCVTELGILMSSLAPSLGKKIPSVVKMSTELHQLAVASSHAVRPQDLLAHRCHSRMGAVCLFQRTAIVHQEPVCHDIRRH